jgi:hypothetical protein
MGKLILCAMSSACLFVSGLVEACSSECYYSSTDITDQIPNIAVNEFLGYQKIPDVAQYKEADWNNVIGMARNVSLLEAKEIADGNTKITYFFYMKAGSMELEKSDGTHRLFLHGDAVFFSGSPWWGTAPGYSDGYVKLDLTID